MLFLPSFFTHLPILVYIFLLAVVFFSVVHYLIYSRQVAQWRKSKIPFLQPTFLVGHKYFLNLISNSYLVSMDRIYRENLGKDAVGFFLTTIPVILLRNPRLIHQVLAKNFDKTFVTGLAIKEDDTIAQNMIGPSMDKHLWKANRRTVMPILSPSRIGDGNHFDKIMKHVYNMWVHVQEDHIAGKPTNTKDISRNFFVDATSHWFFGQEVNSYEKEGALYQMTADFIDPSWIRMASFYAHVQFRGAHMFLDCLNFLGKRFTDGMEKLLKHIIKHKDQNKGNENDFVDFLMAHRDEETDSGMSMTRMVGLAVGTTLITRVPTEQLLACSLMHLLSLHPKCQEKIRNEVVKAMQKYNTSQLTFEVVQDLRYTDQCIRETIRLYPIDPAIVRICTENFKVPGTDYVFKKWDRLVVDPYSVHRDPKYFRNPDTFDPKRFSPENKSSFSSEAFLSFGLGPRKCPGYNLGLAEMTIFIASLLLKFDIKPRSHKTQMNANDFHPKCFFIMPKQDILVDLIPHKEFDPAMEKVF